MTRAILALLHAFARIAIIASAIELDGGHGRRASVWAALSGGAFLVARALGSWLRARLELDASQQLVRHVLRGDLFAGALRGEQNAVVFGLYDDAHVKGQVMPALWGDIALAAIVVVFTVTRGEVARLGAFLVGAAVGLGGVIALRRTARRASTRAWEAREAYLRHVIDTLDGATEIVANAAGVRHEERLSRAVRAARGASWRVALESLIIGRLPIVGGMVLALGIVWLTAGATRPEHVGQWAVLGAMLTPFTGLASAAATLAETRGAITAVRSLWSRRARTDGNTAPKSLGAIMLAGVCVRYGETYALRDVDLTFSRGLWVLRGSNGSGKTTLLRLLSGLVVADAGSVTLGDVPAERAMWNDVRKRTSMLAQRPYVPVGATVRDELTFLFDLDDDACRAALERVDVWRVIAERSKAAPLSVRMEDLSAGERQRVTIARAIARRVELYLFDEPDSNLDQAGIERVRTLLGELAHHATVVVAAHTPVLVAAADHVVDVDGGHVSVMTHS